MGIGPRPHHRAAEDGRADPEGDTRRGSRHESRLALSRGGRRGRFVGASDLRTLEAQQARKFGDRWRDGTAIESALVHAVSRFRDPGRGQGLGFIRKYVNRWDGKISVRSGTARLALVPGWDDEEPLEEQLPFFPGAQVQVTIPGAATSAA